jgi:hypothetical protein
MNMEWLPDDNIRITPPPVRKTGKLVTNPLRQILTTWGSSQSDLPDDRPAETSQHPAAPAKPHESEEACD